MSRALALMLAAATLVGCSSTPEQPLLQQFFSASRLRDNTTLAGFAAASFEPGTDGIVTTFTITNVTPEERSVPSEMVVVDMSINGGPTHVDLAKYHGELVSKEVSISAPVKLPSGQIAQKNYVVTRQRARLQAEHEISGRWIITKIREASAGASTPRL
jgi:hypothetical protein